MAGRVLVTGASGFVAGHCVTELADHEYAVRGTIRRPGSAAHLSNIAELVMVDLESDDGWADAVAGCTYVLHVASPFPLEDPADEDELVRPAVQGTLRVLRASARSGTVERVVLTSSVAAIRPGHPETMTVTEDDWAVVDDSDPYEKSKTLAERAAWDFVRSDGRLELVVINPGLVLGPVQQPAVSTSLEPIRRLLARDLPGVPRLGWATVDVRDLAVAHRVAMELPGAAGNRYICAGQHVWMHDMAKILATEYRVPTRPIPRWLMWTVARFDPSVRAALDSLDRRELVSAAKARRELGWSTRPLDETLLDTARSLIDQHLVAARTNPSA
jgi:nucleoside-diphosphate-sugar epimerase